MKKLLMLFVLLLFGCNSDFFYYYRGEAPALPVVQNIMDSTVAIYNDNNIGTGTILKKTNKNTYILTCAHIISPNYSKPFETIFDNFMKLSAMELTNPFAKNWNWDFLLSIQKPVIVKKSKWISGVQFTDAKNAKVFVIDRTNDICLLKVEGDFPGQEIKLYKNVIPIGTEVYHVGTLLGYLDYSVLSGIISHNSRGMFGEKIQVDIKATFGSSGGGIFTKDKGEYVGMVSEKSKSSDATIIISVKKIQRWMEVFEIEKGF